jgi:predicted transcriptional regulator
MEDAMSEATFTFRVDASLKDDFAIAAKGRDRSGAQILRDFMRDFVKHQQEASQHEAWFRREVQTGVDAADAGDVISAEEVEAEAQVWRAQTGRRVLGADA